MQTDILPSPGSTEATAIREDYTAALSGLRRFVSMGFRLMDVKERLPHGKYISWCNEHLGDLSRTHLYNAHYIAQGLSDRAGLKCSTRWTFENLPPEIEEQIDGSSSLRSLLGNIQEYRHDQAEEDAKVKCEEFFATDLALRDEWEPRVLSGELNWCQAIRGIVGQDATKGKARRDPDYSQLAHASFKTLSNSFRAWDSLRPNVREDIILNVRKDAATWPTEILDAIRAAR